MLKGTVCSFEMTLFMFVNIYIVPDFIDCHVIPVIMDNHSKGPGCVCELVLVSIPGCSDYYQSSWLWVIKNALCIIYVYPEEI